MYNVRKSVEAIKNPKFIIDKWMTNKQDFLFLLARELVIFLKAILKMERGR